MINVAEVTPYNLDVIDKLKCFDYETFSSEYKLNPCIFGIVKEYLMNGDITGTFKYTNEKLKEIEQVILKIQEEITANEVHQGTVR